MIQFRNCGETKIKKFFANNDKEFWDNDLNGIYFCSESCLNEYNYKRSVRIKTNV